MYKKSFVNTPKIIIMLYVNYTSIKNMCILIKTNVNWKTARKYYGIIWREILLITIFLKILLKYN